MKNKLVASFVIIGYAALALSFLASLGYTIYSAWEGVAGVKASDFGTWQFPHYVALFSGIFLAISTIALFKYFRVDTIGAIADAGRVASDIVSGDTADLKVRAEQANKLALDLQGELEVTKKEVAAKDAKIRVISETLNAR